MAHSSIHAGEFHKPITLCMSERIPIAQTCWRVPLSRSPLSAHSDIRARTLSPNAADLLFCVCVCSARVLKQFFFCILCCCWFQDGFGTDTSVSSSRRVKNPSTHSHTHTQTLLHAHTGRAEPRGSSRITHAAARPPPHYIHTKKTLPYPLASCAFVEKKTRIASCAVAL